MGDEVGSLRRLAHQSRVAVVVGLVHLERRLGMNLALAVDLDDAPVAGLGDHRQPVVEALEAVNLDLAVV